MRFRNPDASWDWLLHDGLGSVRGVFDGTLQSAAEYDPFGEPIVAPTGTAYGFTGELTDGNGLVYLRARYLAPGLGTFASRDPWRGSASAPRTWNGYAWVEGNVVNRVDPGGMQSITSTPTPTPTVACPPTPQPALVSTAPPATSTPDPTLVTAAVLQQTATPTAPNGLTSRQPEMVPTPAGDYLEEYWKKEIARQNSPLRKVINAVGDAVEDLVPVIAVAGAAAVAAYGFWLLPLAGKVIAGAAAGSAALNTVEQVHQLGNEPRNQGASLGELLSQVNFPEAALSGVYGGVTTALAFATGGWSLVGSGIAGGIAFADAVTRGEGRVSFSTLSGTAWGGVAYATGNAANALLGLESLSLATRLLLGSPIYSYVGAVASQLQYATDTIVTDGFDALLEPQNEWQARAALAGVAGLSSAVTNPWIGIPLSLASSVIASALGYALER